MDLVARIDEALSSDPSDLALVRSLIDHGGFAEEHFHALAPRRAILALKMNDLPKAISEAFAATYHFPTKAENFALLSHLLFQADADDLGLEMLAKAVELEPDDAPQHLNYLQKLAMRRPGYLKQALPKALALLKDVDIEAVLALATRTDVPLLGACWQDNDAIAFWVCAKPDQTHIAIKAMWFINDGWVEQVFQLKIRPGRGYATARIPSRDRAEACTLRAGRNNEVLQGSPVFGPLALHPARPPRTKAETVEVIVPIYDGLRDTKACIAAIRSAQGKRRVSLTLILDCPPDPELAQFVSQIEAAGQAQVIRNKENLGFTASVNRALRLKVGQDVVLLNSDTIVSHGWIDRLHAVAYSQPDVGTITPLTNNGEIVSFPDHDQQNPLPIGTTAEQIDVLTADGNAGEIVDLPTGVGFCLFIKAECLQQTGLLDSQTFGKGYGEETDFCMRARQLGWRSVCAADVFVAHTSSVSFGDEKAFLVRRNMPEISRRYPEYPELMKGFIKKVPLEKAKHRLARQLLKAGLGEGRILVIAPKDWRTNEAVRHIRYELAAYTTPVYWLFTDPKRSDRLILSSDGLGGLGGLSYDLNDDISDILADLALLSPTSVHWLAPVGEGALTKGVTALGRTHNLHLLTADMAEFLDSPAATELTQRSSETITYSGWGQKWATARKLPKVSLKCRESAVLVAQSRGEREGKISVAVVDGFEDMAGFETLLGIARHAAAQSIDMRFFLLGASIDDVALARTGVVTGLGSVQRQHRADLVKHLECSHVMSIAQDDDPAEYRMRAMCDLGLKIICFEGGCRAEVAEVLPDVLVLPRKASGEEYIKRILASGQFVEDAT